jgi:hypothetical protein
MLRPIFKSQQAKYHDVSLNDNSGRAARVPLMRRLEELEDELAKGSQTSPATEANVGPARSDGESLRKKPSAAALRALAEAQERRARPAPPAAPEINGRGGLEPVRYGDWEVKGLASDF